MKCRRSSILDMDAVDPMAVTEWCRGLSQAQTIK
jgi:hypothetical protein